jgi:hypothetical protein
VEVEPRLTAEGVIVVHAQEQRADYGDATQRGCEQGEAGGGDLEYPKHAVSEGGVGKNDE